VSVYFDEGSRKEENEQKYRENVAACIKTAAWLFRVDPVPATFLVYGRKVIAVLFFINSALF
jgi:hypothetical protein